MQAAVAAKRIELRLKKKKTNKKKKKIFPPKPAANPQTMKIDTEKSYHLADDPDQDVDPSKLIKGYKYGKNYIPFNPADEQVFKLESERSLKVLGFTDEARVPRHYLTANVVCFVPDGNEKVAAAALSAFIHAMIEMKQVAIVRYVYRANADPALGVLWPCKMEQLS